jgi:type II secretory pathway pseudopilin PulG
LLELLTVVAIIGIIAAIAIPRLVSSRRAAYEAKAVQTLRNMGSGQFAYAGESQAFGTFEELIAKKVLAQQFQRGVGGTSGQGEVVSDGTYGYSMVFSPNKDAIDIFATPLRDPDKFRFFLYRLGRGDLVASEGGGAIGCCAPPHEQG